MGTLETPLQRRATVTMADNVRYLVRRIGALVVHRIRRFPLNRLSAQGVVPAPAQRQRALGSTLADMHELLREIHDFSRREGAAGRDLTKLRTGVDALLRKAYIEDLEIEYPFRLTAQRFKILSQNGEDGVTLAILREAGVANGSFIDIGCGQNGGNSGFLAEELGWSGLMVDASEKRIALVKTRFHPKRVQAVSTWVTRETVNDLLERHGLTGEIDLFSIDIDGNDYWVWEALTAASPRIVVIEINPRWGSERAVVVPYDPEFDRHRRRPIYYGTSLAAVAKLGERKGYRLVAVESRGINAFLVRNDVAPTIPAVDPRVAYYPFITNRAKAKAKQAAVHLDEVAELYAYVWRERLPLVDLNQD